MRSARHFQGFAWGVLAYNVGVVLWGAYVRATGSGAGCGGHWPLCNGEVVPRAASAATVIEYTHRLTSGLAVISVVALWVWALLAFPRGNRVRRAAWWALGLIAAEALLGAGLVLLEYVARNVSLGRAVYLSLHLTNTLLLLGMLAAAAWLSGREGKWAGWGAASKRVMDGLGIALAVSITGAVAALGDTLFPASSLVTGVQEEFSATAHILLRLRMLHPAVAVAGGAILLWAAAGARRPGLLLLVLAQLVAGAVNVALLAPVWMQLFHLLLADLVWIALVVLLLKSADYAAH